MERPSERELCGSNNVLVGDPLQRSAWAGQTAGGYREPRDEADTLALAVLQDRLGSAVNEVVAVLDCRYVGDGSRSLDLGHGHLRKSDARDLAFGSQLNQGAQRVGERNLRIGAMQLEELGTLQAKQAKALFRLALEVLGFPVHSPAPGAGLRHACFGGNDQVVRVGV